MSKADITKTMEPGKALKIVWQMAKALYRTHGEFCEPVQCLADATTALDTVGDFIVKRFAADEVRNQTGQERLSALFAAMERHGNAAGTETQLGDAGEFLRLAFDSMSPAQQTGFLENPAVSGFIAQEKGEEEENEPMV